MVIVIKKKPGYCTQVTLISARSLPADGIGCATPAIMIEMFLQWQCHSLNSGKWTCFNPTWLIVSKRDNNNRKQLTFLYICFPLNLSGTLSSWFPFTDTDGRCLEINTGEYCQPLSNLVWGIQDFWNLPSHEWGLSAARRVQKCPQCCKEHIRHSWVFLSLFLTLSLLQSKKSLSLPWMAIVEHGYDFFMGNIADLTPILL